MSKNEIELKEKRKTNLKSNPEKQLANITLKVSNSNVPIAFEHAKFTVEPMQFDLLALLLHKINEALEVGVDIDTMERTVVITPAEYMQLRGYATVTEAKQELKHKVCGDTKGRYSTSMINNGFDVFLNDEDYIGYNLFSKIAYKEGTVAFTLTEKSKTLLTNFCQSSLYKGAMGQKLEELALADYKAIEKMIAPMAEIAARKGLSYIEINPTYEQQK